MNHKLIVLLILLTTLFIEDNCYAALHDPTEPLPSMSGSSNLFTLWQINAIFISPTLKKAVLNGTEVKEGDYIAGARVISIEPNTVQLETENGKIILHLLDSIKKVLQP